MSTENAIKVLDRPLSRREIEQTVDSDGYVSGVVRVDLSEIVDRDLEGFLDLVSERLCGSDLLMDVSYSVVGHEGNEILLRVEGDPSEVLNPEGEE